MSTPETPNGTMPEMTQFEDKTRAMPREFAGAVNLMAHPVAGAAAVGALGLGLASHALGLWLGAMAGIAEASQKMMAGTSGNDDGLERRPAPRPRVSKLELVSSEPEAAAAAARTAVADVESAMRQVVRTARKTAQASIADAEKLAKPAAAAMARPAGLAKPQAPDDLKAIAGIGPKLERVLNGLGIWTYAQIAALTDAEIAWLDDHLGFAGRIGRDDWIGQAKRMMGAG